MDRLWATWRMPYIESLKDGEGGCIFCEKPASGRDAEVFLLARRPNSFVILNTFPYNPGHVMIAPYRHVRSFSEFSAEERIEIMDLIALCETVLYDVFHPNGMNVGVNLGKAAGAGVPGHLHVHLVPRWQGDANFMPVLGGTKVLPQGLHETYERLRDAFASRGA